MFENTMKYCTATGKTGWLLVSLGFGFFTITAMAVEKSPAQVGPVIEPFGAGQIVQVVLGLLLVLLAIVLVAWIMKRVGGLQSMGQGVIKPLSVISIGQRERLVLVQVGEEQLLLGVAPGHITRLHQLTETVSTPQQRNMPRGFSELFSRLRQSVDINTSRDQQ